MEKKVKEKGVKNGGKALVMWNYFCFRNTRETSPTFFKKPFKSQREEEWKVELKRDASTARFDPYCRHKSICLWATISINRKDLLVSHSFPIGSLFRSYYWQNGWFPPFFRNSPVTKVQFIHPPQSCSDLFLPTGNPSPHIICLVSATAGSVSKLVSGKRKLS